MHARRSTVTNVFDATGLTHVYAVNNRRSVTNEMVISDASTNTLTRLLDAFDRPSGLLLDSGYALFYGRDGENRIAVVSNAAFTARYAYTNGYVTGHTLTLPNGSALARVMTRDQHRPNLTTGITNLFNGASVSSLAYAYDIAGRVTNRNDDAFGYNARSEVIGAVIGTNSYGYAYDAIGNRMATTENTKTTEYLANELNRYTQISVPSVSSVVNPTYDADGNMRWDGRMWHTWDAENRLTRSEPGWDGSTNGAVMVDNRYDYRHRRCSKTVRRLSGRGASYPFDPSQPGTWDVVATHTFVYDGWNLVRETVSHADGTTDVFDYFWGLDLSGTLQGAGGVGGLLAVRVNNNAWFFPLYDNNGNVTDYVDAAGNIRAHYEYSPFGEITAQSGDLTDTFKFRFSTKYWDEETRSYYYGYRHYAPKLGCWLSEDPIGEWGGRNLHGFVRNDPVNRWDVLGLAFVEHLGADAASLIPRMMPDDFFRGLNLANRTTGSRPKPGENLGYTTYPTRSLNCTCEREKGNKKQGTKTCYKVVCKVAWTAQIYLNQMIQGDTERLMGAFGHEQRHVKAVWDNVQSKIVEPLENEVSFFDRQPPCNDACKSHRKTFWPILLKLTEDRKERHGIDGHPNEGQLYAPLAGSAWKGPVQGR